MAEPIDLTQQALTALADAGLGNESAAESFVIGYQAGYDAALTLAISIETHLNSNEPTDEEIETCARGFFEGTPGHQLGRSQRALKTSMAARGQESARRRQHDENRGGIMSIISKEACFRYPNCTVDDVHDTLAQVYTSDDLQEAYMTGAEREPTGLEVEAAAEQLYYSDCNSSGLLLDSDWNRLPDGNKAIYRNRVRTIITTIQKKGTAE